MCTAVLVFLIEENSFLVTTLLAGCLFQRDLVHMKNVCHYMMPCDVTIAHMLGPGMKELSTNAKSAV